MPESEKRTEQVDVGSVIAESFPVEFGRPVQIKPDTVRASTNPPNVKLVPKGREKMLVKNSILASHSLNLPFQEWLLLGQKIYKLILSKVEKFDYEHEREFFEVYRELLVAKDSEDWATMSTNEFLYFRRELVERLTNRLLGYIDGITALDGAFANLCILSNVNGTGRFKTFGLSCKWSYINTASNTFDDFVQFKGLIDYIGKYSKWCVGQTNQGTTFVSVPEWDTSIYGNRGQHTMSWSDIIKSWSVDGDSFWLSDQGEPDYATYRKLLSNMTKTITRYGQDISLEDDHGDMHHASFIADMINPSNDKTVMPSISHLENGAALTMIKEPVEADTWTLNADTSVILKAFTGGIRGGEGSVLTSDNIINRAWDTYNFWVTYMQHFYDDIFQRNSVIRNFMLEDLKDFFEPGVQNYEFSKKINVDGAFDAADFQKKMMVYKAKGAPATATIVRWEPLFCDFGESSKSDENFDSNYRRVKFSAESEEELLNSAKEHVRITPTQFDSICAYADDDERNTSTPTVVNSISSASTLIDQDGVSTPLHSPLGQFGAMLDRAMAYASKNPDNNVINTVGAIPDEVKSEFVDRSDRGVVVFDKDPINIWVSHVPLVDSTDPYQCGWNVIISDETVHLNVWESYFRNKANFLAQPGATDAKDEYSATEGSGTEASPNSHNSLAFAMSSSKKNMVAHVCNPDYLKLVKHAKVFIGDAIWETPESIPTRYQSGNYDEAMVFARSGEAGADATDLRTLLIDHIGDWVDPKALAETELQNLEDDDIIMYLIGLASCPNDPSIEGDAIKYIMSPFDWLHQWMEAFSEGLLSDWEVHQWTFAPNYGPVCPVVYEIPAHLPNTLAPVKVVESGDPAESRIETSDQNVGMSAPAMMLASSKGFDIFSSKTFSCIDSLQAAGQYLLWFLDNFAFTKTVKSQWDLVIADTKVALPGFSGPAKEAFALLCRGSVYHMGHEDFDSVFENTDRFKEFKADVDFNLVSIDMGNLVVPPKVNIKKADFKPLTSWRDRSAPLKKVTSYVAIEGKNETSGVNPDKKQDGRGKEHKPSPRSDKRQDASIEDSKKIFDPKKNRFKSNKDTSFKEAESEVVKDLNNKADLTTV